MKKLLNKKGFTIVELVIVIAVIAILAAVLIPTFSNVIESANKSADLSEAQNSLKAYSAYTSSKGQSLADGTVFKVKKSNRAYVFYKGSLHEFKEHDAGKYSVILTIGDTNYASNKMTAHYLDDSGKENEFEKSTEGFVNFFYSTIKNVTFEDGSLNCEIYPGRVVYTKDKYVEGITEGKYTFASLQTLPDSLVEGIVNVTVDGEQKKILKVTKDNNGVFSVTEYNKGSGSYDAVTALPALTNKTYTSSTKGVTVSAERTISINADYVPGTTIEITTKDN